MSIELFNFKWSVFHMQLSDEVCYQLLIYLDHPRCNSFSTFPNLSSPNFMTTRSSKYLYMDTASHRL